MVQYTREECQLSEHQSDYYYTALCCQKYDSLFYAYVHDDGCIPAAVDYTQDAVCVDSVFKNIVGCQALWQHDDAKDYASVCDYACSQSSS